VPDTQTGVPPVVGHTCPHVPQLVTSELVLISQPLLALPSQLVKPVLQVPIAQVPLLQAAEAFV